jgi:hypothetical protein
MAGIIANHPTNTNLRVRQVRRYSLMTGSFSIAWRETFIFIMRLLGPGQNMKWNNILTGCLALCPDKGIVAFTRKEAFLYLHLFVVCRNCTGISCKLSPDTGRVQGLWEMWCGCRRYQFRNRYRRTRGRYQGIRSRAGTEVSFDIEV